MFLPPWTWRVRERFTDDYDQLLYKFNHASQNKLNGIQHVGRTCQSLPGPYSFVLPGNTSDASQARGEGQKTPFPVFYNGGFSVFFTVCLSPAPNVLYKKNPKVFKGVFSASLSFRLHHSGKKLKRETRRTSHLLKEKTANFFTARHVFLNI